VARARALLQVQPQATRHRLHPDDIRRRVRDHRIEGQSAEGAEAEVYDRPVLRQAVAWRVRPAEDQPAHAALPARSHGHVGRLGGPQWIGW
jgi:hypothetical protein